MYDLRELFLIRKVQGNQNDEDCSKCTDDQYMCHQYNLLKLISLKHERKIIYHITICCQFIFLLFLCFVVYFLAMFVLVLCLMCPMVSSSYKNCPFVIAPSVVSNVRVQLTQRNKNSGELLKANSTFCTIVGGNIS